MSILDNEKCNISPDIIPTARSEHEVNPQNYLLAKISEIKADFLEEIARREKLAKKIKRLATILNSLVNELITAVIINCSFSTLAFTIG